MTLNAHTLAQICDEYWQFLREERPIAALMAGQPFGTQLLREGPADVERRAVLAKRFHDRLLEIDTADLDMHGRATYQLLAGELTHLRETFELRAFMRPSLFPIGPEFVLATVANMANLFNLDDARIWLARLASVPEGLEGIIDCLQQGIDAGMRYPRLSLSRAALKIRGMLEGEASRSVFHGPFVRAQARFDAPPELVEESLRIIAEAVVPSLTRFAQLIEGPLTSCARESLSCVDDPQGREYYQFLIRHFASVDESPQAIHALGLSELDRLQREALQIAADAGFADDLEGFRSNLMEDPAQFAPSGEALREEIEVLSKRIDARLPAFFGRLPRMTYGVCSMPESTAMSMPPAYAQGNPADNSGPGIHWITSIPSKLPRYMHIPIALHEAWPGHLMHLALLQEQEFLPDFRRYGAAAYAACLEGWALYCEHLGEEMGLYDTPQKRYGRLEMEIWRAVRLVVDTGLHAMDWSREHAIAFARSQMAMPLETVEAEVDRYVSLPAQALAYQLGNLKMRELRRRAEHRLGSSFRLRDFHDAVMNAGGVSLPVLDSVIGEWIDGRVAATRA